jgi:hypothetical protein
MKSFASVATAALLSAGSAMATLNFCLSSNQDVCFRMAVPEATAQSGSGNFYFQMRAPSSYAWLGLGTGTGMNGANIFLMYQDGNGNVTISPRSGSGHVEPQYDPNGADLELLEGSGVVDGEMIANVRCSNCNRWDGGSLDFSGTGNFISAWRRGSMSSSELDAGISVHDSRLTFNLDLSTAQVSTDAAVNPFVSSGGGNNNDDGGDGGDDGDDNNNNNNGPGSGNGPISIGGDSSSDSNPKLIVHGVLMAVTFVALYPTGAFLQPLLKKWFLHAGWQMVAFIIMWIGFGFGYVLAQDFGMLFKNTHTILGTVVCSLMCLQPILGFLHHQHFLKHHNRGAVSYAHIFYGRSLMIIGIVNGGLGLQLANAPNQATIAYIVVTVALFLVYAVISINSEMKRLRASGNGNGRQPYKARGNSV